MRHVWVLAQGSCMPAHGSSSGRSTVGRAVLFTLVIVWARSPLAVGTGSFNAAGSMAAGRASATAAVLSDGRLLIAGNDDGLRSSEIYDPWTSTFSLTGSLTDNRSSGSTGVALADGRVLIVGGWNGAAALATAELYDPVAGAFSPIPAFMTTGRVSPGAVRLVDGRVLIVGGHNGSTPLSSAELFDPLAGTFTPTGNMVTARIGTATLLDDGGVLLVGGQTSDGTYLSSAELYNPALGTFSTTGSLQVARHGHQATRLTDGRVLVTGGVDNNQMPIAAAEVYNPFDGTFGPAGQMATARINHGTALLADGTVLTFGGQDTTGALSSAEIYDPATAAFTQVSGLGEARSSPSVAALADGRIFVAGGRAAGDQLLATAEIYAAVPAPPQPTSTSAQSSTASSVYGQAITYTATVTAAIGTPQGEVRFVDGGTLLLGSVPLGDTGTATLVTSNTPAGVRSITAAYDGSATFEGSTSAPLSVSVAKATVTSSLTVSPLSQAYSDRMMFEVTVSGANGASPADGVNFKIGMQQMNGQPVPFKNMGGGMWKATLADQPLLETSPAGQLRPNGMTKITAASFVGPNPNYSLSNPSSKAVLINKEDAGATYDGPRTVSTSEKGSSMATIPLRATITDIADGSRGDIRLAQVSFVNRATNAVIATVNVSLTDPSDTTTGVAKYDWNVDIGTSSSKSYTVGLIVSNYYSRNSANDNATVTVSKQR